MLDFIKFIVYAVITFFIGFGMFKITHIEKFGKIKNNLFIVFVLWFLYIGLIYIIFKAIGLNYWNEVWGDY